MNNPKNHEKFEHRISSFGILSPFLKTTEDGRAAMVVYKCIRFDCDYISPSEGFCRNHQTELVAFVFVMK